MTHRGREICKFKGGKIDSSGKRVKKNKKTNKTKMQKVTQNATSAKVRFP